MKRLFVLILVGLSVAGCKSQAPVNDPFFGRTTIPPPATGSATGRATDASYQPPPLMQTPMQAPSPSAPPVVQLPAQPTSQSAPLSVPSAAIQPSATAQTNTQSRAWPNYNVPRPTSTAPASASGARPSYRTPAPGPGNLYAPPSNNSNYRGMPTSLSGRKEIVGTLQPRAGGEVSAGPVDIMDLPKTPVGGL